MSLNDQRIIIEIREDITQSSWNLMKMKTQPTRTYETQQRQPKKKVCSHKCIYQKYRKISSKLPNAASLTSRKTRASYT
jgi:hypothetical protein